MAVHRFQIVSNKKAAILKQNKREIATLLAESPKPKEEKARIRAESVARDEYTIEAHEILQLNCDLLAERIKFITASKTCPPEMESCIGTLIWSCGRVDIPELEEIKKQFKLKYGKKFILKAENNEGGIVNERVMARLSIVPPSTAVIRSYMGKIAEEYEVKWEPSAQLSSNNADTTNGYSIPVAYGADRPTGEIPNIPTASSFATTDDINSTMRGAEDVPVATATFVADEPSVYVPPVVSSPSGSSKLGPPSAPIFPQEAEIDLSIPLAPSIPPAETLAEGPSKIDHVPSKIDNIPSNIPTVFPSSVEAIPLEVDEQNTDKIEEKNIDKADDQSNDNKTETSNGIGGDDYDELLSRFNALKK